MTDDRLLTAAEVAELLTVTERWVRDATRDGRLPAIRLGRYVRYCRADVLAWIELQKSPITPSRARAGTTGGTK